MEEENEKDVKWKKKNERKASEKHKELANYIKKIHTQLRLDSENHGVEEAWKKHILQDEKLKNYAKSMYQLATEHWEQKSQTTTPLTHSRIEWIKHQCIDYFYNGGIKKFDDKEQYLIEKDVEKSNLIKSQIKISTPIKSNINILDVGSCYNPFATENCFSVTAVDIAPYTNDVMKCDFLNLKVGNQRTFLDNEKTLVELPKSSFDAVIFSLLLEYIPSPEHRYLCCKKAFDLLSGGGILLIVTPDSKHQGANVKIVNTSWKVVLAKLGFMRIHYEKLPHIHCMIFRKCFYKETAMKRIDWRRIPEDDELYSSMKIFIPQDFQSKKLKECVDVNKAQSEHNDEELMTLFDELPCEL